MLICRIVTIPSSLNLAWWNSPCLQFENISLGLNYGIIRDLDGFIEDLLQEYDVKPIHEMDDFVCTIYCIIVVMSWDSFIVILYTIFEESLETTKNRVLYFVKQNQVRK